MQTAQRRAELESITRQQKVDSDQKDALTAKQVEIANRLKALDETESALTERKKKVEAWIAETQSKVSLHLVLRM